MEQKQEMHDVVEMLLIRMRDYPEDFVSVDNLTGITYRADENKWIRAYGLARHGATEEEQLLLEAAYQAAKRAVYMGAALKMMLSPDEPMEESVNRKNRITNPSMATTGLSQSQLLPISAATSTNIISQLQHRQREAEMRMQQDLINAGQL